MENKKISKFPIQIQLYAYGAKLSEKISTDLSIRFYKRKHDYVKSYLKKNYMDIVEDVSKKKNQYCCKNNEQKTIWIFWWQGEKEMPSLVKQCINSIKENANGHKVILLDQKNIERYVEFPKYIWDKVRDKKITLTHLSDLIRITLLAEYGGLWLDATLFVTQKIPEYIFEQSFYSVKVEKCSPRYVSQGKWSAFLLGGKPSYIYVMLREFFFDYWKKEDAMIDYFLIDYVICIIYEKYDCVRQTIDEGSEANNSIYRLAEKMNELFDKKDYEKLCEESIFYKLNWRYKSDKKNDSITFGSEIFNL